MSIQNQTSGSRVSSEEIFASLRKGQQVAGRYMGVEYTGTVRGVRQHERTGNREVEIDLASPITTHAGCAPRTGLILNGIGARDTLVLA